MANHEMIKINNIEIWQPDKDLSAGFETMFTEDSTRTQDGVMHSTPMFTVEQYSYTATSIPMSKAVEIIQQIAKGNQFTLHYFSVYYGEWRDAPFYVGKGNLVIRTLQENKEVLKTLSFNMTGVNPI